MAMHASLLGALGWLALCCHSVQAEEPAPEAEAYFEKHIRPVLIAKCYQCHSAEAVKAGKFKGGLLLDTRDGIRQGGESGPAVVPGDAENSLILGALRHEDFKMPPTEKLPDDVVAHFELWIKAGAFDPREGTSQPSDAKAASLEVARQFWSFQPVKAHEPPAVQQTSWPKTDVDRFILARLEAANLSPDAPADKRALLRRATFDLTGLPPTAAEMDAFLADESPAAFEQVIDRLLASPRYGERWGRHWLDVVRYADTAGETADFPSPHAWRYRNYVIDAFNADKPYNEFLREQLAGDLLAKQLPADAPLARQQELKIATGYIAIARRFGFNADHDHYLTIEDTIDTLGKSVLGLTIGCARCHDHKYDPISAHDYYALYGIFDSTLYAFPGSEHTKRPANLVTLTPDAEVQAAKQAHQMRLEELQAVVLTAEAALKQAQDKAAPAAQAGTLDEESKEQIKQLEAAAGNARQNRDNHVATQPVFEVAYAVSEASPHNAKLHKRGDPKELGDEIPRGYLELFGGATLPADAGSGRLQLAEWLTAADNPLTVRVIVNRVWQQHFGVGLVSTPNDFGIRGTRPSHPELLDTLAAKFMADGWSFKKLHRLLMLSSVYQQGSGVNEKALHTDAENKLLWHFPRRRLSVEELRDSMLAVSGELDLSPGGPHPFPDMNSWNFTQHNPFVATYATNQRSVFQMNQRIKLQPMQALFDGPDPNSSTPRRFTTTVPTQALFFLNSEFVHQRAATLAAKVQSEPSDDVRLQHLYRLLFDRLPTEQEHQTALLFMTSYAAEVASLPEGERLPAMWQAYARVLLSTNEFVYVE
jgi:hypothetical protein